MKILLSVVECIKVQEINVLLHGLVESLKCQ